MSTINGTGTKLYGFDYISRTSTKCIKTEWFCILYIPILPICSYIVHYEKSDGFSLGIGLNYSKQYRLEEIKLFKKQVYLIHLCQLILITIFTTLFENLLFIIPLLISVVMGYLFYKEYKKYKVHLDKMDEFERLERKNKQ